MSAVFAASGVATSVPLPVWLMLGLLAAGAAWLVRFWPQGGPGIHSLLLWHAAGSLVAASVVTAAAMAWAITGELVVPAAGVGRLPGIVVLSFTACLTAYWIGAGGAAAHMAHRDRARLLPDSEVRQAVAAKELAAVPALHPHFLFNTMNAICGYAVRRDHGAVIAMLTRLSDLLRAGYRQDGATVVPLPEEVRSLQSYLELQQLRHGTAIHVDVALDDSAGTALVPPMVLQALVEAGIAASAASFTAGAVRVRASCVGDMVEVEVLGNEFPEAGWVTVAPSEHINTEGSMLRVRVPRMIVMEPTLERAQ
jgi:hypothetical protein